MLALGGVLLLTLTAPAQTAKPSPAATADTTSTKTAHPSRHVAHHHRRHDAPKPIEPVVMAPAAPPPPVPPVQQAASPAKIYFRHGTLRIDANNSSLMQILNDVSRQSGLVVDGLNRDERVYGQYGPGPVASTLTKLLDGAGYNYVITGGSAAGGTPMKLMLTAGNTMPPSVPATYSAPTPVNASPEPANPSEPVHAKTPQEIFNELRAMRPRHRPPP